MASSDGISLPDSIAWKIKSGRPKSVPGCQNTDSRPHLPDGSSKCGENEACFYYRCQKCLPELMLGVLLGTKHEKELVFVPPIENIKPKEKDLFKYDPGYRGEIDEFFGNYLQHLNGVNGVAINGWTIDDAAKVFENIGITFTGTKYEGTNFEIDFLIVNGRNLFVVEVGERHMDKVDDEKGTEKIISDKISQITKDQLVISLLLQATGATHLNVFYLAVFPNIPFEYVQRRLRRVPAQQESLNAMTAPLKSFRGIKSHFGVISRDSFPSKTVHLYQFDACFHEPRSFESLLHCSQDHFPDYLAATVILSKLLTETPENRQQEVNKKKKNKGLVPMEDEIKDVMEAFPPRDWDREYMNAVDKKAVDYTSKPTPVTEDGNLIKFPRELIFGVEQVAAINSNFQHTILMGEAGSGKTIVLLAVLYKYTGKHVKKKNLKKVHFLIPSSKSELRAYVESFIERNCRQEWTHLGCYSDISEYMFCNENIYLIDELEGEIENPRYFLPVWCKLWISHTTVDSAEPNFDTVGGLPIIHTEDNHILRHVFLRNLYRSPPQISKTYSKLRRLIDQNSDEKHHTDSRIPNALSQFHRVGHSSQRLVVIDAYHGIIPTDKLSLDADTLIVCWRVDCSVKQSLRANQNGARFFDVRNLSLTVSDLNFTGSEYKKVVIVIGGNIDLESKSCLLLLYNSISRATEKVQVFCHEDSLDAMNSLMTHSDESVLSEKEESYHAKRFMSKVDDVIAACFHSQEDNFKSPVDGFLSYFETSFMNFLTHFLQMTLNRCQHSFCFPCFVKIQWSLLQKVFDEADKHLEHDVRGLPENFSGNFGEHFLTWFFGSVLCGNDGILDQNSLQPLLDLQKEFHNIFGTMFGESINLYPLPISILLLIDDKLSRTVLPKISTDMLAEHFGDFFDIIFRLKSAECFESLVQRLKDCPELLMIKSVSFNASNCNCLMIATANTHHFFKLMECYSVEELVLLLHQRDRHGFDCLFHACLNDNFTIVKYLLTNFEYDLSTVDEDGGTVITHLARRSNIKTLQYLFEDRKTDAIAASKIISKQRFSFLLYICLTGSQKLMNFFMETRDNQPPLLSQIFPFPEYAKHLIDCMHSVWFLTETKAKVVAKRLVAYICDKITDENLPLNDCAIRGSNGETLLMVATICTDTLQKLLHLADAQNVSSELLAETDQFGNSILRWACLYGNLDSIKLLITQYKLDWRTDVDNVGDSLIHELCMWGNFEALNYFYLTYTSDFMALLMIPDKHNQSCLYYACHLANSADIVELLLEIMDERDLLGSNMSMSIDCLLAARDSKGPHKAEIQQIFLDYFNKKLVRDFKDAEEVIFAYHGHTFKDSKISSHKSPAYFVYCIEL